MPEKARRALGFDVKGTVSLGLWLARRKHGVPRGALPVPYASGGSAVFYVVLFSIVVETVAVEALIRGMDVSPTASAISLALHAWAVVAAVIVAASYATRPHVVTSDHVRVRQGAFFDLRVPRAQIADVRLSRVYDAPDGVTVSDATLTVAVASQTNVVLTLTAPIEVTRPLGARAHASTIHLYADDPTPLLTPNP
ncbi:hypothetical protein [Actinocorallia sp. A-T 12471]|uniref:hypothetical protein n=1 Tax=Actinocorallia sp. A-T 12471 TaxID=3089813 RepID=UPI0029CD0147|nr:hypothetical protein [Actinocorallia sp. A-T 12471]MDX6742760.1 hypothetical protein [Actinocorallia sp. A-T 12471]